MNPVPTGRLPEPRETPFHSFDRLPETGVLWLINRVVFHPRGFALAIHRRDGEVVGWSIQGDGHEPWSFLVDPDEDRLFLAFEELLRDAREHGSSPWSTEEVESS